MKDPARTWNAVVVGEDTPCWSGTRRHEHLNARAAPTATSRSARRTFGSISHHLDEFWLIGPSILTGRAGRHLTIRADVDCHHGARRHMAGQCA
jgi:hypothetical protein